LPLRLKSHALRYNERSDPSAEASRFEGNLLSPEFIQKFTHVAMSPDPDLAPAALLIARLEYPRLDASGYLSKLDDMGAAVVRRVETQAAASAPHKLIDAVNRYLFDELGFAGNREKYDDPRNSFLNEVLDRRTGIPITLALVYIEVARRAGIRVEGVNFPGHFLLRMPLGPVPIGGLDDDIIVDPFHGGALLSERDCRNLLREHVGDEVAFDQRLLAAATKQQILVRMLVNLKRIYVRMRSFPQGHAITELLLALNPSATTELRDRGLLAYHLNDFAAALRDLEAYLRFTSRGEDDASDRSEHAEIWEHVKTLRRRVASLN
jgi:regulator of sirC expression with transglutaminase-like and TPR domain